MAKATFKSTFPSPVRHNWGYWEGIADRKAGRPQRYLPTSFHQDRPLPSWDKPYRDGYAKGFNTN